MATIAIISDGCSKMENLLDVTFNVEYSANLEAVVPPLENFKNSLGHFSASATIDPISNNDFQQYADKIKECQITSISARVVEISKQLTLEHASIAVFSSTRQTSWSFTDEVITVGKTLTLDNENNQWDVIQNILEDQNSFTIDLVGQTDVDDVQFTIEITIKSRITANPL